MMKQQEDNILPDQSGKSLQAHAVAILFADISKSSRIYELLGDHAAQNVIGRVLGRLRDEALKLEGRVIKTVGDALICTFDQPADAIEAAKSMLQAMTRRISSSPGMPAMPDISRINIHVGIHYGSVVFDNGDIFGDAVNITSRVVDYANPRQIVATRAAIRHLPEDVRNSSRYLATISAKNISGEIELCEIVFEPQDLTAVLDTRKLNENTCTCLYLTWGDKVYMVDSEQPVLSVGRQDYNDLVIKCPWISRSHAQIENRKGVFMVYDKSTNGTFVYPSSASPQHICKGEKPLVGEGLIVFGREKDSDPAPGVSDVLRYAVR